MSDSGEWKEDYSRNVDLYTNLYKEHGISPASLNWGSRDSQCRRFEVLSSIGDLEGASILDIGCGLGDFYAWLKDKKLSVDYTGMDITPCMIDAAKDRFPEVDFQVKDIFSIDGEKIYDYVFASGIFYLVRKDPEIFMRRVVKKMFLLSKVAVGFNSLSAWAGSRDDGEFYADPSRTLTTFGEITPYVCLRHDYHPGDFSMFLYRNKLGSL
jgi:SAM-dependent methyltransferase